MKPSLAAIAATLSFIGVSVLVAIIALLLAIYRRLKDPPESCYRHHRTGPTPRELSPLFADQSTSYDPSLEISMAELVRATANFAPDGIVGDGGFGLVYRANLSNGITVAAKKLSADAFQGIREFRAEMDTLGKLKHDNIVKILGFCSLGADRVLLYEYMENGSLDHLLVDVPQQCREGSPTPPRPLSWDRRVKVARDVAEGLRYLHGLETPIIHRDIKSSNVLLDGDFRAHIGDFGLARTVAASRSYVSTQVAGTMGYMPPEYKEGVTAATTMADVYSFGVLMLEIATARGPSWPVKDGGSEMGLVQWTRRIAADGRWMEMVDPKLRREELPEPEVVEFFRIAALCSSDIPRDRPAMSEVVELLNRISTYNKHRDERARSERQSPTRWLIGFDESFRGCKLVIGENRPTLLERREQLAE